MTSTLVATRDTGTTNTTGAGILIEERFDRLGRTYFVRTDGLQRFYSLDQAQWFGTLTAAFAGRK